MKAGVDFLANFRCLQYGKVNDVSKRLSVFLLFAAADE